MNRFINRFTDPATESDEKLEELGELKEETAESLEENARCMGHELVETTNDGNFGSVGRLLDSGADIHYDNDRTLQNACYFGSIEAVKFLISRGADVNALNGRALHEAGDEGFLDIVKILVNSGVDIHAGNDEALRSASASGKLEVVKFLLDKGARMNVLGDVQGALYSTALCCASDNGYWDVVDELLRRGADIHAGFDRAMWYAGQYGKIETVIKLLDRGASMPWHRIENKDIVKLIRSYPRRKKYWKRWRRFMVRQWARRLIGVWYRPDMPGGMKDKRILSQI